jgi:TrmH family RNA methyltransferase
MRAHRPQAGIDHPHVKRFRAVKRSGAAYALEGLWAVRRARDAGLEVDVAFVCPELLRGDAVDEVLVGIDVYRVSERVLRRMVDRDGPDGVAAVVRARRHRLPSLGPHARVLVADALELAGNVGTLIRCADGAGCDAVVLSEPRVRVTSALVVKASTGTVFTMPVVPVGRDAAIAWLRSAGVRVIIADPSAPQSYREVSYEGPVAIVLGNERHGVAAAWRDVADEIVSIPMLGVADSLNVGHAAALLLYEALAQRGVSRG